MEHIYIATSPQFAGLVKIGRTDRDVAVRMGELAGYGLEGFEGESTWSAKQEHLFVVEDNAVAETLLHKHFEAFRLSDNRELFLIESPDEIIEESLSLTGGTIITDIMDESMIEVFAEHAADLGIAIAGAAVGGAAGVVIAIEVKKRLQKTETYKQAMKRTEEATRYGWEAIKQAGSANQNLLNEASQKSTKLIESVSLSLPTRLQALMKSRKSDGASEESGDLTSFGGKKRYLLGTFRSIGEARAFAKSNPKLVIQRLAKPASALWAVYAIVV